MATSRIAKNFYDVPKFYLFDHKNKDTVGMTLVAALCEDIAFTSCSATEYVMWSNDNVREKNGPLLIRTRGNCGE